MRLKNAMDKYLLDVQVRTSEESYRYEKSKCSMLLKFIGNKKLKTINRDIINQYIVSHRAFNSKISNASLNKAIDTLNRVIAYIGLERVDFKKLKTKRQITPTVSTNDKDKIFTYLENGKNRGTGFRNLLLFRLLDDTGLRLKEVRHLELQNIDIDNNSITVTTTKTDSDRIVYFTNKTKELLIEYIDKFNIDNYLMIDFNTRQIISTSSVETVSRRMRSVLGLSKSVSPHKWRHTFANDFSKSVNDLESLRVILGHSNITTTQRYLHHDDEYIKSQYFKSTDRRTEQ
ncbi:tyrosine-type recombinase/integrase [Mycoplasmatota bacterium WC44]